MHTVRAPEIVVVCLERFLSMTQPSHCPPVFHIPDDLAYECIRDGHCCQDLTVNLDEEEQRRILDVDWAACSNLGPKAKTPFTKCPTDPKEKIFKRVGVRCGFIDEQGVCLLHQAHGMDIKPGMCQRFPFRFVKAPDGVYVGASFTCVSIRGGKGRPLTDMAGEIEDLYRRLPPKKELPDILRFDSLTHIRWEDYLRIEGALTEIISFENHTVGECLIAGHVWLGMLSQMIRAQRKLENTNAGESGEAGLISKVIQSYVEHNRNNQYERIFTIASRPAANRILKRMLLGSFISFRGTLSRRMPRLMVIGSLVLQNMRHWARLGSLKLAPLKTKISYADCAEHKEISQSPEAQALLRRYFQHVIFRKDLVHHTDLFRGYCYLVVAHGLIEWYAAALATSGEKNPVSEAVSHVERYYVIHSDFGPLFLYYPGLAEMMGYLFQRPNFAHTVING